MSRNIRIENKLIVLHGNKLLVPGCEPTSAVTSVTLMRQDTCCGAIVDLVDALEAIPGSTFVYLYNTGDGVRRKYFVLPPVTLECPCETFPDWYQVLKDLACETPPEEPDLECGQIDMGFCPSPDFQLTPQPNADPYFEEGQFPAGTTVGTLRQPLVNP